MNTNKPTYKHQYGEGTVYSNVIDLIKRYGGEKGIHIDIGCGYGAIAQSIQAQGLTYVGLDLDEDSVAELTAEGFETGTIDLSDPESVISVIERIIADRVLSSITMIDVLEHITNGPEFLARLRDFVGDRSVLFVAAVPNAAHRDLAVKLLGGRWDYTKAGLLDHTHVVHHTDALLCRMALASGWTEVGRFDFSRQQSDQYFPSSSPLISEYTPLNQYLSGIRARADGFGAINELVRAYIPGPKRDIPLIVSDQAPLRPFLTLVTRTQGRRAENFRDLLLALTAQTCDDFEMIVIAHKVNFETLKAIERLAEDAPERIRNKIRVVSCDSGTRTTPLNLGFELGNGEYIAVLDDDEMLFAHWVETFKEMARQAPGKMLRVRATEQDIADNSTATEKKKGYQVVGAIRNPFPAQYDLYHHLFQNYSPPVSLAFPREVFHELGIRFDESLHTAEDWDFELRCAFLCGVESSPEITCIYRKWKRGESSYTVHSKQDWQRDHVKIINRLDGDFHIFPPGTIQLLLDQRSKIAKLERLLGIGADGRRRNFLIRFLYRHPALLLSVSRVRDVARTFGYRLWRRIR